MQQAHGRDRRAAMEDPYDEEARFRIHQGANAAESIYDEEARLRVHQANAGNCDPYDDEETRFRMHLISRAEEANQEKMAHQADPHDERARFLVHCRMPTADEEPVVVHQDGERSKTEARGIVRVGGIIADDANVHLQTVRPQSSRSPEPPRTPQPAQSAQKPLPAATPDSPSLQERKLAKKKKAIEAMGSAERSGRHIGAVDEAKASTELQLTTVEMPPSLFSACAGP